MKARRPRDAAERGACRYSDASILCEAEDPTGLLVGCTRRPGHQGDHIATDQVRVLSRWSRQHEERLLAVARVVINSLRHVSGLPASVLNALDDYDRAARSTP